jgi:hypothetical protein
MDPALSNSVMGIEESSDREIIENSTIRTEKAHYLDTLPKSRRPEQAI